MGSSRIQRNEVFLNFIATPPTVKQRQAILRIATDDQVLALAEIVVNTLAGNIQLSSKETENLNVYKKDLRRVGSVVKKIPWKSRRSIIVKMGKVISLITKKALQG